MKKLFYLFLILGLVVTSCNKPDVLPLTEHEISFKASAAEMGFKSTSSGSNCEDNIPTSAQITIWLDGDSNNEVIFTVDIFFLGGEIFTQTFKLPTGTHSVRTFDLIDDNNNESLIYTVPFDGSNYAGLVSNSLPFDIEINSFTKDEFSLEVLCFIPDNYEDYGFTWFGINIIEVGGGFCFFGDICLPLEDNAAYSANTLYSGQLEDGETSLPHDIPAIFQIRVMEEGNTTALGSYNNEDWNGKGAPLCVPFPANLAPNTKVFFELWVYILQSNGIFEYEFKYEFSATDNIILRDEDGNPVLDNSDTNDDGFLDFVIGDCASGDIIIPPTDPPTEDCEECKDHNGAKITELTLRYTGTIVNPHIIVTGDGASRPILYDGTPGNNPFTFIGQEAEGKFKAKTFVQVVNGGSSLEIHTSCSVPLYVGQVFGGDFEVVSGTLLSGATLCDSNPNPDPTECGECDGKISQLTLRYIGDISDPHIKVTDDKGEIIYEGDPTDTFSFIGQKDKGDMGVKIFLYVNDGPAYEIHTSCSVDIYAEQTWGDYYIVSGESVNGGPLCTIY